MPPLREDMGNKNLEEALKELPPQQAKLIRDNITRTKKLGRRSDEELQALFQSSIEQLDRITANKGVLFIGFCMDERCSTCGLEASCALSGIEKDQVESGDWAVVKFRFPPFFAGENTDEEDERLTRAAEKLAGRIAIVWRNNPDLDIRVLETIHPGCGGGQALFDRKFYPKVETWREAVRMHHQRFFEEVRKRLDALAPTEKLSEKEVSFEIVDIPPEMMQPNIDKHYATACVIGMLGENDILRLQGLITGQGFPRTYQINGQYLYQDPKALAQVASLAAQISIRGHALPTLVTEQEPFQYIIVYRDENALAVQAVEEHLRNELEKVGLSKMAIIRKVLIEKNGDTVSFLELTRGW